MGYASDCAVNNLRKSVLKTYRNRKEYRVAANEGDEWGSGYSNWGLS